MAFTFKWRCRWRTSHWWRRTLMILVGVPLFMVLMLIVVILLRALSAETPMSTLELLKSAAPESIADNKEHQRAERLAGALKIRTVSYEFGSQELEEFLLFHTYIEKNFPAIHNCTFVKRDVINVHSLLYTVSGLSKGKLPYLLASHLDVVPADAENWDVDPFGGKIVNDSYVYGRGSIDDKGGVMGILEALEYMINKGERPQRTFYLAFGHDEEISGQKGAQEIVRELQRRGVNKLDFVLDEGYTVTKHIVPGTNKPVALVGVTEKGTATLELSVTGNPGHSSFPPWESAIGILADAVARLERNKLPSKFGSGPERSTFEYLAPHVNFGYRVIFSNLWLFSGLMASIMSNNPLQNAIVRTTTAITMFNGGIKDNVVPALATAIINHRIHPSQTVAEVIEFDKQIVNDPRIHFKVKASREAHPISPFGPNDLPFQMISASITQTFPDAIVAPGLLIANTDTRWYLSLTNHLFRFFPTLLKPEDTSRYHGNNERISIESYKKAVNFYYRVIKNADLIIGYVPSSTSNNEEEL